MEEFAKCLAMPDAQGIDPRGLEAEGLFQGELFLSRPASDANAGPLEGIVTVSSGHFN